MAVAKLSSQCRKRVKYKVSTAVGRATKQQVTHPSQAWVMLSTRRQGHTFHAIVGEPLAELIDDDEEDAQREAEAEHLEARENVSSELCNPD